MAAELADLGPPDHGSGPDDTKVIEAAEEPHAPSQPIDLDAGPAATKAHKKAVTWLGPSYDLVAYDVVHAAAAVEQLDGEPVWLLVVSGSGGAKTVTIEPLAGAGATAVSTISSEAALLSGTARKERAADATGGLLTKLGPRGLLVIKDFTSIMSMNRDARASVLAALREIYDGSWRRELGTDGGKTLSWEGRLVLIGATTSAYDAAHGVIAAMGDRFALVRMDSRAGRRQSGQQALANIGHEVTMRAELAEAARELLAGVNPDLAVLSPAIQEELLDVADIVTLTRTAVERDYQGNVTEAHAPEAPTRFAKMLGQVVRGALSLGMSTERARVLALRVAHDSLPPMRAKVLGDVLGHPGSQTSQVQARLQLPRTSVDRALQELHILGLLEQSGGLQANGTKRPWCYLTARDVDQRALSRLLGVPAPAALVVCAACGGAARSGHDDPVSICAECAEVPQ